MTLQEFVDCIAKEIQTDPEMAKKELKFACGDDSVLEFLSIYADDISNVVWIDIG